MSTQIFLPHCKKLNGLGQVDSSGVLWCKVRFVSGLKLPDAIIAASAINAVLLTNDRLHGVEGLECRELAVMSALGG
jgi:hypothetical protein